MGRGMNQRFGDVDVTLKFTPTLDPEEISANTTEELTFTVLGLKQGDVVVVNKPSHTTGVGIVNARVSADDTLALTFMNATGSGVNPGSEVYTVLAFRFAPTR